MCSSNELVREMGSALARLDPPTSADSRLDTGLNTGLDTGIGSTLAADYLTLRALTDQLQALSLRWLAALDATGIGTTDGSSSTAAWVRRHTTCSGRSAAGDVRLARRLHTDPQRPLTTTAQLLTTGQLTVEHAHAIARATTTLDPAAFDLAEPTIAQAATTLGVDATTQLATTVADHTAQLHADSHDDPTAARQAAAEAGRRLHLSRCGDHFALDALLTVEAGEALQTVLEPLSAPRPAADGLPDARTAAQRRADALAEAARQLLTGGGLPTHGGQRPQLTVLVDLGAMTDGLDAGRFADGGRLSARATDRLACDAVVSWVATTSTGADGNDTHGLLRRALQQIPPALGGLPKQVLDAGRAQRLVTSAQRRVLDQRDRGCVFPGCDRPPGWCDAHHLVHWSRGGPTDLDNLVLLCAHHHTTVHDHHWALTRHPDGTTTAHPPP